MPRATTLSYIGLTKELVRGTALPPTFFWPVKTFQPEDKKNYLPDTGVRGSMVDSYDEVPTSSWGTYTFTGDVFADAVGYHLYSILGETSVVGVGAPFTHTFNVYNAASANGQPPSYTFTDFNGFEARSQAGALLDKLEFKFSGTSLLDYTASLLSFASVTATTPSVHTFSTDVVRAGCNGTVTIGGTATTVYQEGTLTIARKVDPIIVINNTCTPRDIWGGAVTVSGKMLLVFEDNTEIGRFYAGTNTSLAFDYLSGTGASTREIKLAMSKVLYTMGKPIRTKNYVEVDIDFHATANTTDIGTSGGFGQIVATVQNAVATY